MILVRSSTTADAPDLLAIWRSAVAATHGFVAPDDLAVIEAEVADYVAAAPFRVAVDAAGQPLGFLGVTGSHVDALFVHADWYGRGVGRRLMADVVATTVDVNEANAGALAFYQRLGFRITGRSPTDDAGRPYPLLHLARDATPTS